MNKNLAESLMNVIYTGLLGRHPEQSAIDFGVSKIKTINDLSQILNDVSVSDEKWSKELHNRQHGIVASIFNGLVGRDPSESELEACLTDFSRSFDFHALVCKISADYRLSKFNKEVHPEKQVRLAPPTAVSGEPCVLTLGAGFHAPEKGFAWSSGESEIQVVGDGILYITCGSLFGKTTNRILITDELGTTEFQHDPRSVHLYKLLVSSPTPKTIKFKADVEIVPSLHQGNLDTRPLAFMLWWDHKLFADNYYSPSIVDPATILFVEDGKKEADSLLPLLGEFKKLGYSVKMLSLEEACRAARYNNSKVNVFVIGSAGTYSPLVDAFGGGIFVYAEHGVSPLKEYTYSAHYCRYDLILMPGVMWSERLVRLYPQLEGKVKTVGYSKVKPLGNITVEARRNWCAQYNLDPDRSIVLFAPTWSGHDEECGLFNVRFLDSALNMVVVPHDGDMQFSDRFINNGFNVRHPQAGHSISDFYVHADLLVSDVSSTAIEFAALGKPVLCIRTPHIPDFDPIFIGKDGTLQIPHTGKYWDFCPSVPRAELNAAVNEALVGLAKYTYSPEAQALVNEMIFCIGDKAARLASREIMLHLGNAIGSLVRLENT